MIINDYQNIKQFQKMYHKEVIYEIIPLFHHLRLLVFNRKLIIFDLNLL